MRVLYGIQNTGNGHIGRAIEILPELQKHADVTVVVSGGNSEVKLPKEPEYDFHGLSFSFGRRGDIDISNTLMNIRPGELLKDISQFDCSDFDLLINDFEPITAWAARNHATPSIALSHQAAFRSSNIPRPDKKGLSGHLSEAILKWFAPCDRHVGFHYERYDDSIRLPIVRSQIRELEVSNAGHVTVYLPCFDAERLMKILHQIPQFDFHVFNKHSQESWEEKNVRVQPVGADYMESVATCETLFCNAGFQATSEALHLGKKLIVIPQKGQYEQKCNVLALAEIGVPHVETVSMRTVETIKDHLISAKAVKRTYPNQTESLVKDLLALFEKRQNALSTSVKFELLPEADMSV